MDVTITLGWWIAPAALTLGLVAWCLLPTKTTGYGIDVANAVMFLFGALVCCFAWAVYFGLSLWLA